jgi:large subunit ribosomal protein L25
MAIIKLQAEPREETGSRATRRLRDSGFIPANLYSHGQPSTLLKLNATVWSKHLTDQLNLVNIEFPDGNVQVAAPREIQRDPLTQDVIHVDFLGVRMDEKIEFHVKINFQGTPEGVKEGGVRSISSEYVTVSCLPNDVPESIAVDISGLKIGDSLSAGELVMPENVELVTDTASNLLSVSAIRITEEELAPAAVAEGEEAAAEGEAAEGEEAPSGEAEEKSED